MSFSNRQEAKVSKISYITFQGLKGSNKQKMMKAASKYIENEPKIRHLKVTEIVSSN